MTIKQLMRLCFDHSLDGKDTDFCVRSVAVNLLQSDSPVISVEMDTENDLLTMLKTSDAPHLYIAGGIFHFNATYNITPEFPAPRIYFMKTPYLDHVAKLGVFLKKQGVEVPVTNDEKFSRLIEDKTYPERYRRWFEKWEARSKPFKGLLDGRIKNTNVERGIWLGSDGCLICGTETDSMSTTTLITGKDLMIGLRLCKDHEDEARNHKTLIEYLSDKMGIPAPFLTDLKIVQHTEATVEMSRRAMEEELDCEIKKVQEKTITGIRKSGFRIIARQDAVNDYAYNVFTPNGKPVSRIDSADHHPIPYGPDHVHPNLSKSKKNHVASSFTFGFAVADLKSIRRLVEEAELRWENGHRFDD